MGDIGRPLFLVDDGKSLAGLLPPSFFLLSAGSYVTCLPVKVALLIYLPPISF